MAYILIGIFLGIVISIVIYKISYNSVKPMRGPGNTSINNSHRKAVSTAAQGNAKNKKWRQSGQTYREYIIAQNKPPKKPLSWEDFVFEMDEWETDKFIRQVYRLTEIKTEGFDEVMQHIIDDVEKDRMMNAFLRKAMRLDVHLTPQFMNRYEDELTDEIIDELTEFFQFYQLGYNNWANQKSYDRVRHIKASNTLSNISKATTRRAIGTAAAGMEVAKELTKPQNGKSRKQHITPDAHGMVKINDLLVDPPAPDATEDDYAILLSDSEHADAIYEMDPGEWYEKYGE